MGEYELIQQMRNGNLEAFEEWVDIHCAKIEQLAIQYGCTRQQAGEVTEETFRSFFTDLENVNENDISKYSLYRVALEKLAYLHRTDSVEESAWPFEEDQQLHEQMINLEEKAKLSLILSQFHKMHDVEIATIMGVSEDTVKEAIAYAVKQLTVEIDSTLLNKRLAFLEKSYERMNLTFRKEQVFTSPNQETRKPAQKKKRNSKKIILTWIAGLLALAAMVIVSIINGEEYQKASAEEYIEQLKGDFEEEIASRYAQLGLIENTEEDEDFTLYGKRARWNFKMMLDEVSIGENGRIDKKSIEKRYDEIVKMLALPSEMLEQLIKHPLTNDKDKSAAFISTYVKQVDDIQQSYSAIINRHPQLIEDATVEGVFQLKKYLGKQEAYPEVLQNALNAMGKQNIYLTPSEWTEWILSYSKNEVSAQIRASLHKDFSGHIALLESINSPIQLDSYDEKIDTLIEIENTLLAGVQIENLPYSLGFFHSLLFYGMATDFGANQIIGADGQVKEEVQLAWRRIASIGEDSPAAHIMRKIVIEMDASGWTESETQSRLNLHHLNNALLLAKDGKLHTFEMNGILQTDLGLDFVTFPDSSFENLVEETYELYSANHDLAMLKEVHPLVIFAVYCFANNNDDPETMWHLYNPAGNKQTLETYLQEWQKEERKFYAMDSLQFEREDSSNAAIGIGRGNTTSYSVQMRLNEEGIWEINHIYLDMLEFE